MQELYRQFSTIADDPKKQNYLPDDLVASLAESLARIFAHYASKERQFVDDLFHIFCDIDKRSGSAAERYRTLYSDSRLDRFSDYNPPGQNRRRPKPFEGSVETCRRLIDLNRVRDALSDLRTGAILGGSVSYGRFFNTGGALTGNPSDTDLLVVLPDYAELRKVSDALREVQAIDKASLDELRSRIQSFLHIRREYARCILSHKLKLWDEQPDPLLARYQIPGHYSFSLHIFSWKDFEWEIARDKPILQAGPNGKFQRHIWDYRNTPPRASDNQRSFSGMNVSITVKSQKVDGGFLSHVGVCHIIENRFYPGLHQNLILPQFEIRWESPSNRLYLPLIGFRWKLLERLHEERTLRPFEVQKLSLSHTRSEIFAKHVTRRVDRE